MKKINEKTDYSKNVLEIDIESQIFKEFLHDLNLKIKQCLLELYEEKFRSGEISAKMNLEIETAYECYRSIDDAGNDSIETYSYRKPIFDHNITLTLKKTDKASGGYSEKREIQFEDGKFLAVPLKERQTNIEDLLEGKEKLNGSID